VTVCDPLHCGSKGSLVAEDMHAATRWNCRRASGSIPVMFVRLHTATASSKGTNNNDSLAQLTQLDPVLKFICTPQLERVMVQSKLC
jgi:hypothetical protein